MKAVVKKHDYYVNCRNRRHFWKHPMKCIKFLITYYFLYRITFPLNRKYMVKQRFSVWIFFSFFFIQLYDNWWVLHTCMNFFRLVTIPDPGIIFILKAFIYFFFYCSNIYIVCSSNCYTVSATTMLHWTLHSKSFIYFVSHHLFAECSL